MSLFRKGHTDWKVGDTCWTFALGHLRSPETIYKATIKMVVPLEVDPIQHYIIEVSCHVDTYTDYRSSGWLYKSKDEYLKEDKRIHERLEELSNILGDEDETV